MKRSTRQHPSYLRFRAAADAAVWCPARRDDLAALCAWRRTPAGLRHAVPCATVEPRPQRPEYPPDERARRRAMADPRYRRVWLGVQRRAMATMLPSEWHAAAAVVHQISPRAQLLDPPRVPQMIGSREQWHDAARAWGLPVAERRGLDWAVSLGEREGVREEAGETTGKNGRPRSYSRATYETTIRAIYRPDRDIVEMSGGPDVAVQGVPQEGYGVYLSPIRAAYIARMDTRDGVRWLVAPPVTLHRLRVAWHIGHQGDYLVHLGIRSYHATRCTGETVADRQLAAARQALGAWRAQREQGRAVVATTDPCVLVTTAHAHTAGYCDPGIGNWLRGRVRPARAARGVPAGILLRRWGTDPRVVRVCQIAAG